MMMDDVMPGMMWAMGLVWFLAIIVLILAVIALVPSLRKQRRLRMSRYGLTALATIALLSPALTQKGDATRGQRDFRVCAPLPLAGAGPEHDRTKPRRAVESKGRCTPELRTIFGRAQVFRDSLDRSDSRCMVADPQGFVPNNEMPFDGIKDTVVRADLLAFLKDATKGGAAPQRTAQQEGMKGMGGMMGGGPDPNLKNLEPKIQVKAISCCRDNTYRVTTADGKTRAFWERNLRFRTHSSKDGPEKGAPAIMPAGMMGDRASVIFAAPEEINKFVEARC